MNPVAPTQLSPTDMGLAMFVAVSAFGLIKSLGTVFINKMHGNGNGNGKFSHADREALHQIQTTIDMDRDRGWNRMLEGMTDLLEQQSKAQALEYQSRKVFYKSFEKHIEQMECMSPLAKAMRRDRDDPARREPNGD